MMPKRWLHPDSEASELERALLALSSDPEPGAGEQERVWQSLLANMPSPTDPDGSAPPAGPTTAGTGEPGLSPAGTTGSTLRGLLVNHGLGFAAGVVTTTLAFLLIVPRGSNEHPTPNASALPTPSSAAPAAQAAPAAPSADITLEKLEAGRPSRSPPAEPRLSPTAEPIDSLSMPRAVSSLSEEAALLREARSRLAHGDLEGASKVLATSKARFPNARLAQEREAASIELLRRSGNAEAAARARAFLAKYPRSPHARQVERALSTVSE